MFIPFTNSFAASTPFGARFALSPSHMLNRNVHGCLTDTLPKRKVLKGHSIPCASLISESGGVVYGMLGW